LDVSSRGDTPHFDYVAGQAASGIQQVALNASLPVILVFSRPTPNNRQKTESAARMATLGSAQPKRLGNDCLFARIQE